MFDFIKDVLRANLRSSAFICCHSILKKSFTCFGIKLNRHKKYILTFSIVPYIYQMKNASILNELYIAYKFIKSIAMLFFAWPCLI